MKMITAVVGRQQSLRVVRIKYHRVELDNAVEISSGSDPCVYRLSVGFAQGARMETVATAMRLFICVVMCIFGPRRSPQ
jgi:hypothetical protein